MKKTNTIILLLFFIFLFYSIINMQKTNESTMNILKMFSKNILPALLPFLIINQLIIKLGITDILGYLLQFISRPLFKISGKGASIILIGLLNGFPSSAIFTSLTLKNNEIEKEEAQRLINSIFFPSLSFLFIIINKNLNSNLFIYLITSIYLTGFSSLYFSSLKVKKNIKHITFNQTFQTIKFKLSTLNFIKDVKEAILYSANTLINILGIIVIFSIPCNIINSITDNNILYFFQGLIEFSVPSINLSLLNTNKKIIVLILSTILSFSGTSSIMQAALFINDANLKVKEFITNRIIISISTTIILYLFVFCFQ